MSIEKRNLSDASHSSALDHKHTFSFLLFWITKTDSTSSSSSFIYSCNLGAARVCVALVLNHIIRINSWYLPFCYELQTISLWPDLQSHRAYSASEGDKIFMWVSSTCAPTQKPTKVRTLPEEDEDNTKEACITIIYYK